MPGYLLINLGELISPDMMKGLNAYATKVAEICADQQNQPLYLQKIGKLLKEHENTTVKDFKLGNLSEAEFDTKMIEAIEKETGAKLTIEEFNDAWQAMNKSFADFYPTLKQAIEVSETTGKEFKIFSFTNPKDIRHIVTELYVNRNTLQSINRDFTCDEQGNLKTLFGFPVYLTYVEKKGRDQLLGEVTTDLRKQRLSTLVDLSLLKNKSLAKAEIDIIYVEGENKQPISSSYQLQQELIESCEKVMQKHHVLTITWNNTKTSLQQTLDSSVQELIDNKQLYEGSFISKL